MPTTLRTYTLDPNTPPEAHGPGTDGPVWSTRRERWEYPLNITGRAWADEFLSAYPWPGAALQRVNRRLYYAALQVLGQEEYHSACLEAVVSAAAKYDPSKSKIATFFVGSLTFAVRAALTRAVRDSRLVTVSNGEEDTPLDLLAVTPDAESGAGDRAVEVLRRAWPDLSERQRQVVAARFGEGQTLLECGRRLGVSKERVRQLEAGAMVILRQAAGGGLPGSVLTR